MQRTRSCVIVLVTAPDLKTARALAQGILTTRLAACVNLVPRLESHYWWQDRIESSAEVLMILKTTTRRVAALERHVLAHHPYDTAEFLVLPINGGAKRYLGWIGASVAA